jgi:predicted nucleic acid-binding protein
MLVDTDVLIWHMRGYPRATRRLDELGALTLSAVSYFEVLQGVRDKAERQTLFGHCRPRGRGVRALRAGRRRAT